MHKVPLSEFRVCQCEQTQGECAGGFLSASQTGRLTVARLDTVHYSRLPAKFQSYGFIIVAHGLGTCLSCRSAVMLCDVAMLTLCRQLDMCGSQPIM